MVEERGNFGMVLEGVKFGKTQRKREGRTHWEKPLYQSLAQSQL